MRLRLLTYNIHKCVGGVDRRYRPDRIRDTIAPFDADVVLLQEVAEHMNGDELPRQADLLGFMLGYRHRSYFPNVRIRGHRWYGNAVLSRFPITETRNIDLTIPMTKRRSALHVRCRTARHGRRPRTVHIFNLHLGLSQILRKYQLEKLLNSEHILQLHVRTPMIVAGDFNDVWGTLGERYLVPFGFRGMEKPLRTFPAWAPLRALDSIYVRGDAEISRVERGSAGLARWASDHLPLHAEVALR